MQANPTIPAHVPPQLVMSYALTQGETTFANGFDEVVPKVHAERPDIFYCPDAFPGGHPAWILLRGDEMRKIYLDNEHFSPRGFAHFAPLIGEKWVLLPAEMDPPIHTRYRQLLNPLFMPKAVKAMEEKLRGYARKYINAFKDRGECEFMQDFAFEFPITVVLELMDLPQDMLKQFLAWEHNLLHAADIRDMADASRKVVDYLRSVLEARKAAPGNDILSWAIKSDIDGRKLDDDELMGFAFNLYVGGLDTVSTTLGNMFRWMGENPDRQNELRQNPDLIPTAIEELLRAHSPATTYRTCIKQTTVCGATIMPGDRVAMATPLAGRDPQAFDRPNEIDFHRQTFADTTHHSHLGFGHGAHRCLGVHLARMELRLAFEEFLGTIPTFRVKPEARIKTHLANVTQIENLPLVWK